jgi:hypothetical protein
MTRTQHDRLVCALVALTFAGLSFTAAILPLA